MRVKSTGTLNSNEVAIRHPHKGPLPSEETAATRAYVKQCCKLFTIFKCNKLEVYSKCFVEWYKETKQESSQATDGNGLKNHWKKFIPRIIFEDLKRSIRAFFGVVQHVQIHHPELHLTTFALARSGWMSLRNGSR